MNTISVPEGLEFVDLALYVPTYQALIIADVHLGFEEALHEEGTLVPRGHFRQLMERLERILAHVGIDPERPLEQLIINGDLSHRFGFLSAPEWKETREFLQRVREISRHVVIIEGNHDAHLNVVTEDLGGIQVARFYKLGHLLFIHGDSAPDPLPSHTKMILMGHEHPAVGLRDSVTGRIELYKCFLVGCYHNRRLVVLPSFNPWVQGTDLTRERCLSPLLSEEALGAFEVYPVSDEGSVYRFGLLEHIMVTGSRAGR